MKSWMPASLVCDWCAVSMEAASGMSVVMQAVQVGALPIIFFAGQPTPTVEMSPFFSSLQHIGQHCAEA